MEQRCAHVELANQRMRSTYVLAFYKKYIRYCFSDGTWSKLKVPLVNFSLMKCRLISQYFVWSCWIGFCTMITALSQYKEGFPFSDDLNACCNFYNKKKLTNTLAITLSSASSLDLVTTLCFLLLQITRFPSMSVQYPDVDLLSSKYLPQYVSIKTSIEVILFREKQTFPWIRLWKCEKIACIWASRGSCMNWLIKLTE